MNGTIIEETAPARSSDDVREAPAPMVLQMNHGDDDSQGSFSFSVFWHALAKRMMVATPIGLTLAAIACAVVASVTEPKYKSRATLQIVDKAPYVAFQTSDPSKEFAETQVELMRGPFIIGRAIEAEGLLDLPELREIAGEEDPATWISTRLKAARIGKSELYEISFLSKYPQSSSKVVQAIVDTYLRFHSTESDTKRNRVLELLTEEQAVRDRDIDLKREKLRELTKQVGGEDGMLVDMTGGKNRTPRAMGRSVLLSNLQQRLVEAEVEVELARAKVAALREEADRGGPVAEDAAPELSFDTEPRIMKLKQELNYKQATLRTLAVNTPRRQRVQDEIRKVEQEIAAAKEDIRQQSTKDSKGHAVAGRPGPLAKAESDLAERERTVDTLREKIDGERGEQAEHGDKSLEVEFARAELENAEEIRRRIAERAVHLTTESRAPERVHVVQKPKTPDFPEGPTLAKKMGMAGLVGFLMPFMVLIGWDLMHSRVFEREQLERQFAFKMVSEVAVLPTRPTIPRPGANRAYELQVHLFEESVNALRTTLSVDEELRDKRVFVVASAVSGEGKTNLSAQLGMSWSLAIEGRVLVIDADLRSPHLHDLFGMPKSPGLAEVLRGECSLDEAVVMDWGDRLFVLPAGVARGNTPSHLFSSQRFLEVLQQLRRKFDKVIVDVPPVLCASETLLIAHQADGVLMCARHDYSQTGQIKLAADRLSGAGINVVGAVLNGAPARKYAYYFRNSAAE